VLTEVNKTKVKQKDLWVLKHLQCMILHNWRKN